MPADGDFPGHPDDAVPALRAPRVLPLHWETVSARKIADRAALLDEWPEWQLRAGAPPADVLDVSALPTSQLTYREREIVHLDATALVEAIAARRYSATEVARAFCHVAAIAQVVTNCLTEVFFREALQRAAELDRHLEETGQVVGPLHGLPVSIKDHILVKGHDTATGYIDWAYRTKATKDAVAVDILRKAGAVLYVKTANPQTLLVRLCPFHCETIIGIDSPGSEQSLETNNNIYGRTLNPFNRSEHHMASPAASSSNFDVRTVRRAYPWREQRRRKRADICPRKPTRDWHRHWRINSAWAKPMRRAATLTLTVRSAFLRRTRASTVSRDPSPACPTPGSWARMTAWTPSWVCNIWVLGYMDFI